MAKVRIYVESIPLVEDRPSGVAHSLAGLVTELVNNPEFQEGYEVVLVAPKRALHKIDKWPGLKGCKRKGLPFRMRILNGLMKFHLLPPMDLFLGRGVYLFGNFKNWPVSKRSTSLTYIHDICFALYPQFVAPKNQRMLIKNVPKFIKQTDYVITVSEQSRREIIDYYRVAPEKVLSLYNGVNTELFRPYADDEVAQAKKRYGVEGEYFLFLSNIEPRKNLGRLVEAFEQMPKDYTLLIVGGSGWLNEEVYARIDRARADGVKIVKPHVFVPDEDVALLLSGAEALVHPAIHEGFGMTPAEALAAGIPVVASDIPVMHEVLSDTAIYCDPSSTDSILAAMKQAVDMTDQERAALREKGMLRVRDFSWAATARKLATFLASKEARE